jgi:hypothetical protein
MLEDAPHNQSRWRAIWPSVTDLEGAQDAITLGYRACFVLAGFNVLAALFGQVEGLIAVAIFVVLGLLVRHRSRVAAIVAVALLSANVLLSVITTGLPFVGVLTIIVLVCLLSAVRGTFAFHRLTRASVPTPGEPAVDG